MYLQVIRKMDLQNANPIIYESQKERAITRDEENDDIHDAIDSREIFDILFKNNFQYILSI